MDQAEKLRNLFENRPMSAGLPQNLSARVITVTSGKGGVGKTNFTVSLGIYLRKLGKRVVILDADFGLANVELIFGMTPKYSLADMLMGDKSIDEIITEGPMDLKLISGGSGLSELANITEKQMRFLIGNFEYLDSISDIILIDTGAGISKSVVNFVKASHETILITTPEPTSITDAYALIKTIHEEGAEMPEFKVIVNRVDDSQEGAEIFEKLHRVSERFMGIGLESLGAVPFDVNLIKAVKQQKPVALCFPNTAFSKSLEAISARLLDLPTGPVKPAENAGVQSFIKRLAHLFGSRAQ
ncbi:MAG: MinD/ParA family protein [Clostridiales bacterium]|jgi:flagellar biosynthesis protein FlhG|nr:MinD/ParA family protein [Clostridiales bacterium]